MKLFTQPLQLRQLDSRIVLAAGFFDGVHKGHQMVLAATVARARETGGQAWALTFDRHPLAVLAPSKMPPLLMSREERLQHLEEQGIDGVLMLPFTRQLAVQEPEDFVRWLCGEPRPAGIPGLFSEIRCGANWHFGARAAGTPEQLAVYGRCYGFQVVIVPYAEYKGEEISSTRIRSAVTDGRMEDASAMLGHPYTLCGEVIHGHGRGATLGFATANICPLAEVIPPEGVYAVRACVNGTMHEGVANLGFAPTFPRGEQQHPRILEVHVLDYAGESFYGRNMDVSFLTRIREERVFESSEALIAQIRKDVAQATQYFRGV